MKNINKEEIKNLKPSEIDNFINNLEKFVEEKIEKFKQAEEVEE